MTETKKRSRPKKTVPVVLNETNVHSVLAQMKDLEFPYTATLKVMARVYEAQGITVSDAISKLNPLNCKGKAILTIKKGENSKERILQPMAATRLFTTRGITREVQLKNISSIFGGF